MARLDFRRLDPEEMRARVRRFYETMGSRRSVRSFSPETIPLDVVKTAIHAAGTAPSGAHRQPWTFVLVTDPALKRRIRIAAEKEEKELYERRMNDEWREALEPLGTTWEKPFLETVPAILVMFARSYELLDGGGRRKNYYVQESCGIALGFLIAALHHAGLATLTHTPSPMGFLADILGRPSNEKTFVLLPVGYPADDCTVPDLARKSLDELLVEV
jgi:nitroreductase